MRSLSLCGHLPPYPDVQNHLWKLRNGAQISLEGDQMDGDDQYPEES